MASIINSDDGAISGTAGLKSTGANDGALNIQTNGTNAITVSSSQTVAINGNNISADNSLGFRNRIINGDMGIDQRNAGAAVTVNSSPQFFSVDRWYGQGINSAGVFTLQRSTTAPTGFVNSVVATVTTVDSSLASGDLYLFSQRVEGFNIADLGWGTANAKSVTLSFWVRSSVTGTFGGSFSNSATNRSYPFTYTINSANTYEYKTITVAGDTSGTWLTDNGIGIFLYWGLGVGTTYSGTAGAWSGSYFISATGATNLMANNGATWYITGAQLEVGSVATPFERRDYGRELMLCQRYYEKSYDISVTPGTNTNVGMLDYSISTQGGSFILTTIKFTVPKRGTPTMTAYTEGGTSGSWGWQRSGASGTGAVTFDCQAQSSSRAYVSAGSAWVAARLDGGHWVASAEL